MTASQSEADAALSLELEAWRPFYARPCVVSVEPFFAKIIASRRAGSVWLALRDTSCVAPGCS